MYTWNDLSWKMLVVVSEGKEWELLKLEKKLYGRVGVSLLTDV